MEIRVGGKIQPILIITHQEIKQSLFLKKRREGISTTYQLFMDPKNLNAATIRKVDTTDYGLSVYAGDLDTDYIFNLSYPEDLSKFKSELVKHFELPIQIDNSPQQIFELASSAKSRTIEFGEL